MAILRAPLGTPGDVVGRPLGLRAGEVCFVFIDRFNARFVFAEAVDGRFDVIEEFDARSPLGQALSALLDVDENLDARVVSGQPLAARVTGECE